MWLPANLKKRTLWVPRNGTLLETRTIAAVAVGLNCVLKETWLHHRHTISPDCQPRSPSVQMSSHSHPHWHSSSLPFSRSVMKALLDSLISATRQTASSCSSYSVGRRRGKPLETALCQKPIHSLSFPKVSFPSSSNVLMSGEQQRHAVQYAKWVLHYERANVNTNSPNLPACSTVTVHSLVLSNCVRLCLGADWWIATGC